MNTNAISSLEQVESFLHGTCQVSFQIKTKRERYEWLQETLAEFGYHSLKKSEKGLLRSYMSKVTGYSRSQIMRLIIKHRDYGKVVCKNYHRHRFANKYTQEDILLLVAADKLHDTLSGPATKKLFERAYNIYYQEEYKRLYNISVPHIYNLRKSQTYLKKRINFTKTKYTPTQIGERRKPNPENRPGFIRVDTVHQGDLDKQKGVYHINAVDEVTQFEAVFSVKKISEAYLIPILILLLETFPFKIINFHSDNGSEYINKRVAKLLNKLFIKFTKSRARHTNDNALVESKNSSIIRKYIGYGYISQKWADEINKFNKEYLMPYINFHRPCFFAISIKNDKGKIKKKYLYSNMMTPYEKLKSLPNAKQYLKTEFSFEELDKIANAINDNEAARRMQKARKKLFAKIFQKVSTETPKQIPAKYMDCCA